MRQPNWRASLDHVCKAVTGPLSWRLWLAVALMPVNWGIEARKWQVALRPIGGVVFGYIGDRHGRRFSLFLSIGAMALGTLAIGLLPTYETAGMLAPILMIACRIVQGLAVGGEYATSIIALVESAPFRRRGFRRSLACLGAAAGNLLGSATGAFLFYMFDENQIEEWGWRIPFLIGVAVALAGIYLRRNFMAEERAASKSAGRFFRIVLGQWPAALRVAGVNIVAAIRVDITGSCNGIAEGRVGLRAVDGIQNGSVKFGKDPKGSHSDTVVERARSSHHPVNRSILIDVAAVPDGVPEAILTIVTVR